MINILGQSHPGPIIVTNLLLSALHSDPRFQAEFYWEDLDAVYHPEEWQEQLDSVVQQYRHRKLDLIVLMGPNAIQLLAEPRAIFPNVPAVFCCTAPGQIDQIRESIIDRRARGFNWSPRKRWRLHWVCCRKPATSSWSGGNPIMTGVSRRW